MPDDDSVIARSHRELEERIRSRAYEIHRSKNGDGSELEDWLEAEREVLGEGRQPAQDRGTTVGSAKKPSFGRIERRRGD
jgi:5-carboxymethyl-2-hydroxymuconate isomerase